ncbi:PRD domain-containing protein [Jeotgalibacillus sp. S-D1]|uniref:BglG family transcription antiterminator n=1 Tax=Jeotgalibacillus sp. S-D1 TaxID=2552189 RepID=UPI00105AA353|nr:BglG family transcription antiterminator [Jeotgalibacillus sp. S-D1]TDL30463.1 PRD domain-containing protein [Jeotgalibacillus sp. S-D1]
MDYITGRERKLIEWLLRTQHQFTTIRELADGMDVSSRTIHRELKKVEKALADYSVSLVKQSGSGIQLSGSPEQLQQLDTALRGVQEHDLQQEERLVLLLHYLIRHESPVKTAVLTRALNCAMGTLTHDLDLLEKAIEPYGLTIIRRRGYGIQLVGSERERRRALANLLIEQIDTTSIYSMVDEHFIFPGILDHKAAGVVSRELLMRVERLLMDEIKELPYTIADDAYLALVIHISLAIGRIQSGEKVEIDENVKNELAEKIEFTVAHSLANSLSKEFSIAIPREEVGYIAIHLRGAKRREQMSVTSIEQTEWTFIVQTLIQKVGQQLGVSFSHDHSLFEGLIAHLEPAIHRAEEGLQAFNPLTETIKEDYPILFHTLEQVLGELFPQAEFSSGELAFLVLHFASSLEIQKELVSISALVVCSSGIGTSKMLASRLKKEFPEITDITQASLQDARVLAGKEYDVIISTIGLADVNREYILVSPLLPENEVEKVRRFLQKNMPAITGKNGFNTKKHPKKKEPVIASLEKLQQVTAVMIQILKEFSVIPIRKELKEEQLLTFVDEHCVEKNIIEEKGVLSALLKDRETLGGLGIPGTELALYHARSLEINRPLFMIFQLSSSLTVNAMDQSQIEMNRMLLLLAPDKMNAEVYELMSLISAAIIEDEEQLAVFTNGTENEIYELLEQKCDQFIRKKMNLFLEGS